MSLDWNFQRGGGGNLRKNPFCGEGMDIFWNLYMYTLHIKTKDFIPTATVYWLPRRSEMEGGRGWVGENYLFTLE